MFGDGSATFAGTLSGGTSGTGYSFSGSAPAGSLALNSSGDLGIGTASLATGIAQRFVQITNGTNGMILLGSGATQNPNPRIFGASTYDLVLAAGVTTGQMLFYTNDTQRMTLDASGNVGIGTASPDCRLMLQTPSGTACQLNLAQSAVTNYRISIPASTDALTFVYGASTERMRLDSSGNLGLGVTPSAWNTAYSAKAIELPGGSLWTFGTSAVEMAQNAYYNTVSTYTYVNTAAASDYYQTAGSHVWRTAASGTAGNVISFTQAMTLDASGNLGIGTTSPNTPLQVNGTIKSYTSGVSNSNLILRNSTTGDAAGFGLQQDGVNTYLYNNSNGLMAFATNGTERMRLDSSGNLLVGTTSASLSTNTFLKAAGASNPALYLFKNSTANTDEAFCIANGTSGGTVSFQVLANGNAQNTNNSYGAISDVKLKENIVDVSPKLADLMQVKVRHYNFKSNPDHKQIGVVAQELAQVFPAMIEETVDSDLKGNSLGTTTKSVKYSVFVPMLIKAMQEQQALITQLTARITALETL